MPCIHYRLSFIVFGVTCQAAQRILSDETLDHEYLPITGLPEFTASAAKLILGTTSPAIQEARVASVQTISGTGANHLGALFLSRFYNWTDTRRVYLSNPTWGTSGIAIALSYLINVLQLTTKPSFGMLGLNLLTTHIMIPGQLGWISRGF